MLIVIGIFGLCVLVFIGAMLIGFDVVKEAKPIRRFSTPKSDRLLIGWIVFLLSYMAFSLFIGGDALNGYSEADKYFVVQHGKATQVGRAVWHISLIFGYLLILWFVCTFAMRFYEWRVRQSDAAD